MQRGKVRGPNSGRHMWQLWSKVGHLAPDSWYRFDNNFQPTTNNNQPQ